MIVHLSTAAALREVEAARGLGQKVFVETCPHYLLLDDSRYSLPDFAGARYVCAPPLRKKLDNERLWKALADGEIQTVSTDHCSFTLAQKDAGRGDFTKIPGGMPGVETRGTLLFTYGVAAGRITAERMADVLAETPAKLYGLFPRKGVLQPGADADIVVYDPRGTSCITAADQAANVDYAPYEGTQIAGHIAEVYLRGTCVVRETVMGSICTAENVCSKAASLHCSLGLHRLFFIWWSKTPIFELFFRQKWRVFRKNACSFFLQGV